MKRLIALLVPLVALAGCATYGDGYYNDRSVYRDGGYYYPAYDGEGDYYYGADRGYDYDYHYGSGIGYGYGYSPFWGLDRYRCRSYYGCVPAWGGYYPYHYSPGWSFSVGNTWGWNNWGWYGGYLWNDQPRYRHRNPRPDYPEFDRARYGQPQPMPKPRPDRNPVRRSPAGESSPAVPAPRRPAVGGERVRQPAAPVQRPYTKPASQPGARPAPRAVGGEPAVQSPRRALVPVQPAPAASGGPRMRYPEPVRAQPRAPASRPAQAVRPAAAVRPVQGVSARPVPQARPAPAPQARPAPVPQARPVAKPAARPAQPAPRPAPRPQVRPASQNSTSDDER